MRLGVKPKSVTREDYLYSTLFDMVKPSIAVWFKCYNEPDWIYQVRTEAGLKNGIKAVDKLTWEIHEMRKKEVMKHISNEWVLFGAYFEIADWIGHTLYSDVDGLMRTYFELDKLARELKRMVPKDTLFLIISDHGMQPNEDGITGDHSDRAFWSINADLNPGFRGYNGCTLFYIGNVGTKGIER